MKLTKCQHTEIEYDFEWDGEPMPMLRGATCLDCDEDIDISGYSIDQIDKLCQDEMINRYSDQIDSAIDEFRNNQKEGAK